MGCLAGSTPHMVSAAVVGLARLLYEFSAELCHTVPDLLPSVLLLLRSKNREIIKVLCLSPTYLIVIVTVLCEPFEVEYASFLSLLYMLGTLLVFDPF